MSYERVVISEGEIEYGWSNQRDTESGGWNHIDTRRPDRNHGPAGIAGIACRIVRTQ